MICDDEIGIRETKRITIQVTTVVFNIVWIMENLRSPKKKCLGGGTDFIDTAFSKFTHIYYISNIAGKRIRKRYNRWKERFRRHIGALKSK